MRLNSEIIGNYEFTEGEDRYTVEADLLTKNSMNLVEVYADYYKAYHLYV